MHEGVGGVLICCLPQVIWGVGGKRVYWLTRDGPSKGVRRRGGGTLLINAGEEDVLLPCMAVVV